MSRITLTLTLVAGAALAACSTSGTQAPVAAELSSQRLTVTLAGGGICTASRADAAHDSDAGWAGRMRNCPVVLHYAVEFMPREGIIAPAFESIFTALGAGDLIAPGARVVLTDAEGRSYVFRSPSEPAAGA